MSQVIVFFKSKIILYRKCATFFLFGFEDMCKLNSLASNSGVFDCFSKLLFLSFFFEEEFLTTLNVHLGGKLL